MPELNFQVTGAEAAQNSVTPLLHFKLQISAASPTEVISGLMLNVQIQFQSPQRSYTAAEKERLVELFGAPEQWGQTLRNRLWTHANATLGSFVGATETVLSVPSSYDLNLAATKYLYALEAGHVPLLFLFSGSIFYATPEGQLQVERISWNKECAYRMSIETWRNLMEQHYPNCAWLYLQRDMFERLYHYRRHHGLATWEQTVDSLLQKAESNRDRVLRNQSVPCEETFA
jgi:hypothetical protein